MGKKHIVKIVTSFATVLLEIILWLCIYIIFTKYLYFLYILCLEKSHYFKPI